VSAATGHRPALWVAIAATVLSLGLPLEADLLGREHRVRVLLVGAIVLIALALGAPTRRSKADHLVVAALVLLGFTAALVARAMVPSGAVLLALAIGSLLWQRRAWARG
jgi:hypothetical protein